MLQQRKSIAYFMWLLPLLFFAYQFILRLWPSLLMQQIMSKFAIDASAFGFLSAVYYFGYSGMQIPIAIALDKFGPRFVIAICAITCGLANLLLTYTDSWALALLSRFLIGAGSAVAFLGVSKVISEWFDNNKYSAMVGYSFTFGLLGALYGGKPVSILMEQMGWKPLAIILSIISLSLGILYMLFLRSPVHSESVEKREALSFSDLKLILKSPIMWWLAGANLLMVGALEGFADVWGVNFLMEAYHLSKSDAAGCISFIFIGMLFGGPLLAYLGEKIGKLRIIATCGVVISVIFAVILFKYNFLSLHIVQAAFFIIGIMCCYQVLVFAAGSNMVSIKLLGITIAFLNSINMLGGSFFHSLIGSLMDAFWQGQLDANGIRIYHLDAYSYALMSIPVCSVIASIIVYGIHLKTSGQESDEANIATVNG